MYEQIAFRLATPPSIPTSTSPHEAINSSSQITVTYVVDQVEDGFDGNSKIQRIQIDYSQNETTSYNSVVTTDLSEIQSPDPQPGDDTPFNVVLTGLRSGTKYNYKIKVQSTVQENYSGYSVADSNNDQISAFTKLPADGTYNTSSNNIDFTTSKNTTSVSTPDSTAGLNSSSVYYINKAMTSGNTAATWTFSDTAPQTFQITRPLYTNQEAATAGYGKWTDGMTNLVVIKLHINGVEKANCIYKGFGTTGAENGIGGTTYFYNASQVDKYDGNANNKGFRLQGTFRNKNFSNATAIDTNIGDPSNNKHVLTYSCVRHADVKGSHSDQSVTHNIYYDNLPNNPSISANTATATVKKIKYTMGIPSVDEFDVDFTRTYANVNSQYQYIKGNRIIAQLTSMSGTNAGSEYIYLARDTASGRNNKVIATSGSYAYTSTEFRTATVDKYSSTSTTSGKVKHTTERGISASGTSSSNQTITITERIYSLKTTTTSTSNTLTTKHYFDRYSYSGTDGSSSTNFNITSGHMREISSTTEIAKLGSSLSTIGTTAYTDHEDKVKDWTLLYIRGKFQSNSDLLYPTVANYTWDAVLPKTPYSAGATAYNTSGSQDVGGYKWIVFDIKKSGSAYTMMGQSISIDKDGDNNNYIDLKSTLSNFFDSSTSDAFFTSNNINAIGFAVATKVGTTTKIVGSFKQPFNPTGGNWTVDGTSAGSYANVVNAGKHGALIDDGSSGKGIYVNITAMNDDLQIYLGLKNGPIQ